MNILIINQHTKNYGDDIAGISLIQELKKRFLDCKITILYNTKGKLEIDDPNIIHARELSLKNIGIVQILIFIFGALFHFKLIFNIALKKLKEIVEKSELIFVSPCGANIGVYKDWRFLIRSLIIVMLGGKLIFHNNTLGKSGNIFFDKIAIYILKRSKIYVREKASQEYLEKIGIFSIRSVDTAFLFKNTRYDRVDKNYSIFIPTDLGKWHPEYKGEDIFESFRKKVLKNYIEFLNDNNLSLYILPHLYGEYIETDLHNRYRDEFLKEGMDIERIKILKIKSVYEYDNYINFSSFVVSMRYHGVVMAINNSVPFISLGYENKMLEVCRYSNMEMLNYSLKDIKNENFKINFQEIWENSDKVIEELISIKKYLKKLASIALEQEEFSMTNKIK